MASIPAQRTAHTPLKPSNVPQATRLNFDRDYCEAIQRPRTRPMPPFWAQLSCLPDLPYIVGKLKGARMVEFIAGECIAGGVAYAIGRGERRSVPEVPYVERRKQQIALARAQWVTADCFPTALEAMRALRMAGVPLTKTDINSKAAAMVSPDEGFDADEIADTLFAFASSAGVYVTDD